jgi:hypothetical protein
LSKVLVGQNIFGQSVRQTHRSTADLAH